MNGPEVLLIGAGIVDVPLAPVSAAVFDAPSTSLERIVLQPGGDALNEAVVLARLGRAPALVSVMGRDAAGDYLVKRLEAAGVNVEGVAREMGLDTQRTVGYYPGSSWTIVDSEDDLGVNLNIKPVR